MIDIDGIHITEEFLPGFTWVADIQYFEGSLLSEYKTSQGDTFVFLWCDCSDRFNRWLVGRTSQRSLYLLTAGLVGTREFFESNLLDNNVYIIDSDGEDNIHSAYLTHLDSVASHYLPVPETYISLSLMPQESVSNYYPVLIDGDWDTKELTEMPKKFLDIFSLISRFKATAQLTQSSLAQTASNITNAPWKGGFSAAFFYEKLRKDFCPDAGIDAIQYASPGYIKFSTDRAISLLVKKNLDIYNNNKKDIDRDFASSTVYLRDQKLNEPDSVPSADDLRVLGQFGENLMSYFSEPSWSWIQSNCPDNFIAIKVARSYVTRIRSLDKYVQEGKAIFAQI